MSNCRSGCVTQDHATWGECARAANLRVNAVMASPLREVWDKTNTDLAAYRRARANGIQPEGTTVEKVRAAEAATKLMGQAYNADTMPPASMITSKAAARLVTA